MGKKSKHYHTIIRGEIKFFSTELTQLFQGKFVRIYETLDRQFAVEIFNDSTDKYLAAFHLPGEISDMEHFANILGLKERMAIFSGEVHVDSDHLEEQPIILTGEITLLPDGILAILEDKKFQMLSNKFVAVLSEEDSIAPIIRFPEPESVLPIFEKVWETVKKPACA